MEISEGKVLHFFLNFDFVPKLYNLEVENTHFLVIFDKSSERNDRIILTEKEIEKLMLFPLY